MAGTDRIVRDYAWVEREYGSEKWPRVEQNLVRLLEVDLPPVVPRIVAQLASSELDEVAGQHHTCDAVMSGSMVSATPRMIFAAYQAAITTSVMRLATDKTDTIVELGSGWGRNLFVLWLAGAPRAAGYVAAEFTAAGRRVSTRIAELDDGLRLRSVAFDYHRPQLHEVMAADEVIVFTAHSIEQIPHLRPEVIDNILALGRKVTCLHFEPVGWQLAGGPTGGSSRDYAEANDYNLDLVAVLRNAENSNKIAIMSTEIDVVGANPNNATSLIIWQTPATDGREEGRG